MRVAIGVYDGLDELDAVGPCEALRASGGDFDVRLVTLQPQAAVGGQRGMQLGVDGVFQPGEAQLLIVAGGGWGTKSSKGVWGEIERGDWLRVLQAEAAAGTMLASVCTGAMLLAYAGITKGRRATTHHSAWSDLAAMGAIVVKERVVDDGDLITAGGITSGIDLGLWIVRRFAGANAADDAAALLEYDPYIPPAEVSPAGV